MPKVKKGKEIKLDDGDKDPGTYELGYLVVPTVAEETLGDIIAIVRENIESHGDITFSEEFPTRKTLAYAIERSTGGHRERYGEAYFGTVKFDAIPKSLESIREKLQKEKKILRYLLVKIPSKVQAEPISPLRSSGMSRKRKEVKEKAVSGEEKQKTKTIISDEELDRTIKELVGE